MKFCSILLLLLFSVVNLHALILNFIFSDINECMNDPCQNGGTCVNSPGSYSCDCVEGYKGDHCQEGKIGA